MSSDPRSMDALAEVVAAAQKPDAILIFFAYDLRARMCTTAAIGDGEIHELIVALAKLAGSVEAIAIDLADKCEQAGGPPALEAMTRFADLVDQTAASFHKNAEGSTHVRDERDPDA